MEVGPTQGRDDRPVEVAAGLGEHVFVPVWIGSVAAPLEHTVGYERLEPGRQHVAGDAQVAGHLPVAAYSVVGLAEDEHRPAVAEHLGRSLDPIRSTWGVVLGRQLVLRVPPMRCTTSCQTLLLLDMNQNDNSPADFESLRYAEDGPVARITLNRPQKRNALSIALSDELTRAIERVQESTDVKVLVVQGAGETFCAGDDISEMHTWGDANGVMRRVRLYQSMANALEELDKVTVAAVDGFAVGGGLEITMACDFVVATQRAVWGMPEVDVGITPGWGGTTRMARLIGRRMTKEVNFLGALHPASRAVQLGLWNRVVTNGRLEAEVEALVEVLLSKNQQAVRQLKFIINRGIEADLYTAQGFETLSAGLTGAVNGAWEVPDADGGAGITGFTEKGNVWQQRRGLAREFWSDGPEPAEQVTKSV